MTRHRHGRWLSSSETPPWVLLAGGELVAAGFVALPDARRHLAVFFLLCAAGSGVALTAARSLSGSPPAFVLLCAALFRATLLFRAPDLSDDLRRYVWDGRVAQAGISPYAHAPSDPALVAVAPELLPTLPHADVPTVYPPVAQAAFRTAAALRPGGFALKALFAAADLAVVSLLRALGGPGAGFAAALYAFHPLPIFESAGEGHVDSLGVALALASLVWLRRGGRGRAGAAFALSVLTKYVFAFAALPLVRRGGGRFGAAALALGGAIGLAWTRGGVPPVGGLSEYAMRWDFNSLAYPALAGALTRLDLPARAKAAFEALKAAWGHPAWMNAVYPYFTAGFLARVVLALALVAVLIGIARRVRDTETAVFASLGAVLLASPTLQPWYLLWVLPLAARDREPAFLYWSFAVPLSYALLYPPGWLPPWLVLLLEYGPFGILLARTLARRPGARKVHAEAA